MQKDIVTNIIEFTGYTIQGDEVIEWQDGELDQHAVQIDRQGRQLPDIHFYFGMQSEAHALFLVLCQATDIGITSDWDEQDGATTGRASPTMSEDEVNKTVHALLEELPKSYPPFIFSRNANGYWLEIERTIIFRGASGEDAIKHTKHYVEARKDSPTLPIGVIYGIYD